MTYAPERSQVLAHYEKLLFATEDTQHANRMQYNPERNAEVQALTADALQFREQHGITISELNAWKKRNVKVATSVEHAVRLLGGKS